ncbi:MAG: cytochrome c [Magnetospirillum sp. WYHS-4]
MTSFVRSIAAAAMVAAIAAPAFADETNPNIVHRQGIYKIAAGHMTSLKAILLLGLDNKDHISYHAKGLQQAFAHHYKPYPPGTDKGETKAKPEIWSKPDDFKAAAQQAGQAVGKLVDAAEFNDAGATVAAFKDVSAACKNCHDKFRKD